jgi:hypothetical protein
MSGKVKLNPTKFTQAVRTPNATQGACTAQPITTHTTRVFLKSWQLTRVAFQVVRSFMADSGLEPRYVPQATDRDSAFRDKIPILTLCL